MAKSQRASSKQANRTQLRKKVFGPVEDARQSRLSAKLLEIVSQPKPVPEEKMEDAVAVDDETIAESSADVAEENTAMDIDTTNTKKRPTKTKRPKNRIEKKRAAKRAIVFPQYNKKKRSSKVKS